MFWGTLPYEVSPNSLALFFIKPCSLRSAHKDRAGVGDGEQAHDEGVDDAGDVGVLGVLVDDAGNQRGAEQNQDDGEEPEDVHGVIGVGHGPLVPHHVIGGVVGAVLDRGQDHRGQSGEHSADHAVGLAADVVVVEAVGGDRDGDVVGEEEQHIGQVAQDRQLKGLDGQGPETEVSQEEVVLHKHQPIGHGDDDQCQQSAQSQLLQRQLHAALGQIQAVLLAVSEVVRGHAEDGEQAAGGGPQTQAHGLALGHGHGIAHVHQRQVDQAAEYGARRQRQPEPELSGFVLDGHGLHGFVRAQAGEGGGKDQQRGEGAQEQHQADHTHKVKRLFPLPDLVAGINGVGRAQRLGEEVADVGLGAGGEVGPGVDDGGTVDDAQGVLAVHILTVFGVRLADLRLGGIAAEVQEGLGGGGLHKVGGAEGLTVRADGGAEEFVIYGGDHAHVAASVGIGEITVGVLVKGVVAVDEGGGDQRGLVQIVRLDGGIDGPAAHGVAGDADAGCIHKGHAAEGEGALVYAVRREDEEVGGHIRVAVVGLVDGQHHEAPAGELHIVGVGHFLVVQIAVAGDNGGGGVFRCGGLGYEQIGRHGVAAVGFDGQFTHDHLAAASLHDVYDDAAQQHQRQGDAKDDLRCFFGFLHNKYAPLLDQVQRLCEETINSIE